MNFKLFELLNYLIGYMYDDHNVNRQAYQKIFLVFKTLNKESRVLE